MRLIDADALERKIMMMPDDVLCEDCCYNVVNAIDSMPTIATDINVHNKWISVKDRLPDSNHVLARCEIRGLYKPKSYTCVAFYAKKNSISVGNCFDDEISCEYDEETDEYYLKEGWYEVIRNWDEYGSVVIGDFVTHWMPLPEPPEGDKT